MKDIIKKIMVILDVIVSTLVEIFKRKNVKKHPLVFFLVGSIFTFQCLITANVVAQPKACAGNDAAICQGEEVSLGCNPSAVGESYSWSPSEGLSCTNCKNPDASPTETTEYTLIVTDSIGLKASDKVKVTINPNPKLVDEFGGSDFIQCSGGEYTMTVWDASEKESISITGYVINWGDGSADYISSSPPINISHTYAAGKNYEMTYQISGSNSCNSVIIYPVINITNPAISTGIPENSIGCGPKDLCFPITDFENNNPATTYSIFFGDGSDTIFSHPPPPEICHTYSKESCTSPGQSFEFVINAINECAIGTATASPIGIYSNPKPDFSIDSGCVNEVTTFTNNSVEGFNSSCSNNSKYTFDFGDGTVETVFNKSPIGHTYTSEGFYLVILTAENSCGSAEFSSNICIGPPPLSTFDLNVVKACLPGATIETINSTITDENCGQVKYLWTIDKKSGYTFRSTGTISSPEVDDIIDFTDPGLYKVNLRYNNGCNFADSSIFIEIEGQVQLSADNIIGLPAQACAPYETSISTDIILDDSTKYGWELFGTPVPPELDQKNGKAPSSVMLQAGSYTFELSVLNQCGQSNTVSKNISVVDKTIAEAGSDTVLCAGGQPLLFVGEPLGGIWSKSGFSPGAWPCLNADGLFDPGCLTGDSLAQKLIYTVGTGDCQYQDSLLIEVINSPEVEAGGDLIFCQNGSPYILDSKADFSPAGGTWIGSGIDNGIFDPAGAGVGKVDAGYMYTDPITGCSGSDNFSITISELSVNAGEDLKLCLTDQVYDLSTKTDISIFGGTWAGAGVTNNLFDPESAGAGEFVLSYVITSSGPNSSCTSSDSIVIAVTKVEANAGADMQTCLRGGVIDLSAKGDVVPHGGTWSGIGVSNNAFDPEIAGAGTFSIVYQVRSIEQNTACTDTDTISISVTEVVVYAGDDLEFCLESDPFDLNGKSDRSPTGGVWQTQDVPVGIFDPPLVGIGSYQLEYIYEDSDSKCRNSDSITVLVHKPPPIHAGLDFTICYFTDVQELTATSPSGGSWSGTGITDSLKGNFNANIAGIGSHIVTYSYMNEIGCLNSDSIEITVCQNPEEAAQIPTAFTPNGDGLNDTFGPILQPTVKDFWFQIASRSNNVVFESDDPNEKWDGNYNGNEVLGVCGYRLHVTFVSGLSVERNGEILVIR